MLCSGTLTNCNFLVILWNKILTPCPITVLSNEYNHFARNWNLHDQVCNEKHWDVECILFVPNDADVVKHVQLQLMVKSRLMNGLLLFSLSERSLHMVNIGTTLFNLPRTRGVQVRYRIVRIFQYAGPVFLFSYQSLRKIWRWSQLSIKARIWRPLNTVPILRALCTLATYKSSNIVNIHCLIWPRMHSLETSKCVCSMHLHPKFDDHTYAPLQFDYRSDPTAERDGRPEKRKD